MDAQQVKATFGFDVPDLSGASTEELEVKTSELVFDKADYFDFEQFKWNIADLPLKCKGKPSCPSLSVNGKVIQDKMEKYLEAPGESSSALKEVLKSPRHYLIYKNEDLHSKDESHFTLGTFIHSAFLEPGKFAKVKVLPADGNKSSKAGVARLIQYYWELLEMSPDSFLPEMKFEDMKELLFDLETTAKKRGYTFIDPDMMKVVNVIRSSYKMYGGGIIPKLIANGRTEVSMYGKDASTGLKVKIRPDCMLLEEQVGANIILSVKTTSATSVDAFMRDAAKYRYHMAEGMYLQVASEITGRKFTGTLMLVAQTVIPYQCFLLWFDAEDLSCGKYLYNQAIDIVKQCKDNNSWPGFESFAEEDAHGIIQAKFPAYIKSELKPQYIPQQ